MKNYLSALTLISALCAATLPSAQAQTTAAPASASASTTTKQADKKTDKNKSTAKKSTTGTAANSKAKKTATKKNASAKTQARAHTESHPLARDVLARQNSAKAAAAAATASKMPFSSDAEDDDKEPDIGGTKSADFSCEMGNKLTIYKNDSDDKHIAIRWNKRINRLTRVSTTTGANRFENRKTGLVWIGIPAKGILLDSKKGQQLANECKNNDPATAAAPDSTAHNS